MAAEHSPVTVIAIDGPSGAGKGTLCRRLASRLGYHYLDSGALYRLLGLAARRRGIDFDNLPALQVLAEHMDIQFKTDQDRVAVLLEGEDVSRELRTEQTGALASQVATLPAVREALLQRQRDFARAPGLVADGRDMGTVVFSDAPLKIYLTASAQERAARRHKELLAKGENVSLAALVEQVRLRDERDMNRDASPLRPAADAVQLDTSDLSVDEVMESVLAILALKKMA
ncbi:(d)CMP kinase [Gammaproteobacteria bacterium LSUCC0057]|uniref:Cytidylate kinase n=1 Tax=Gammaproteobacteria bacterium LSUCC0057 TaxID=2559237 RepID=A0A4Y8UIU1_9GAMM|nr:(d)CMP kinase [Gammaproteobacteria bacterium LSUCC0057]